ncbi:hypothetical protein G6F66_015089 [Rhizopus arrhizus]|nr:hypothetical protein G6F66_015089 [Rhizopus arrhizus]
MFFNHAHGGLPDPCTPGQRLVDTAFAALPGHRRTREAFAQLRHAGGQRAGCQHRKQRQQRQPLPAELAHATVGQHQCERDPRGTRPCQQQHAAKRGGRQQPARIAEAPRDRQQQER